jgi:hypothetical protein
MFRDRLGTGSIVLSRWPTSEERQGCVPVVVAHRPVARNASCHRGSPPSRLGGEVMRSCSGRAAAFLRSDAQAAGQLNENGL